MFIRNVLTAVMVLAVFSFTAGAQNPIPLKKSTETRSGTNGGSSGLFIGKGLEKIAAPKVDIKTIPYEHSKYTDSKIKELEEEMQERKWGSEDTAWERACELDTKDAYRRYIAIYPNGAHRPAATKRIIDIEVRDAFEHPHEGLPGMIHTTEEDSPESTIYVENATEYMLTVMFSGGEQSESILVSPGGKGFITLPNGNYTIAASVPKASIRPYAGKDTFTGGRYDTTFYVVRRNY